MIHVNSNDIASLHSPSENKEDIIKILNGCSDLRLKTYSN